MSNNNNIKSENIDKLYTDIMDSQIEYAIIFTNPKDEIVLWNKGAEVLFGYRGKSIIGKKIPETLHLKDKTVTDVLYAVNNTDPKSVSSSRIDSIRKDGSKLTVSISSKPEFDKNGRLLGYLYIARDISNEKIQENYRNLLIEISYIVNMTDNTVDMLYEVLKRITQSIEIDSAYICLYDKFTNNFNLTSHIGLSGELKNHTCNFGSNKKSIDKRISGCFESYSQYIIHTEQLSSSFAADYIDHTNNKDDLAIIHVPIILNEFIYGILHIVLTDKKKDALLNQSQILSLISNEIAAALERKRLESEIKDYTKNLGDMVEKRTRQLREKDAQLVQSGKLATLGEMAAGIAHEINQPLGGISLITQGLLMAKKRRKLTGEMMNEKLNEINSQIDRINKIINHLKDFSRQSDAKTVPININEPLKDVFKLIGQQLKKRNILFELELDENLPKIRGDYNRIEQVFINLIGNARDALDEFEREIAGIRRRDAKMSEWQKNWIKHIIIKTYAKNNSVFFEISDSGVGIPEDKLSKIFEPFYTTKEAGKGTGLGLTISYNIIKDYNGTISVESLKNLGTTFIIKFPEINK